MDKKTLFSKLRILNLKPRFRSSNRHVGNARSTIKGTGMSFSEVREYHFGDEVRTIDWNVTARYNVPHVKIFEEEKEQHFLIVLDSSTSNMFSENGVSKWDKQIEVAAMIAFTAWKQNDHFGLLIFSDEIEHYIPFSKGRMHFYAIIDKLLTYRPGITRTSLELPFEWLSKEKLPRSTIFFASDFLSNLSISDQLKKVVFRHKLFFICVRNKEEEALPDVGWVQVENFESGRKTWINTSSEKTRFFYRDFFDKQTDQLDHLSVNNGIKWKKLFTDENTYQLLNSLYQ